MSSSCVPPKGCVLHDPDPTSQEEHIDTVSECGSLCTCTSDSLTSLAEIREMETAERVGQAETQHLETSGQEESGNPERMAQTGGRSQGREGDSRNPRRVENPGRVSQCEGRNPDRAGRRHRERLSGVGRLRMGRSPLTSLAFVSGGRQTITQASDSNNNPYTVMLVPSQAMQESDRCGMCQRRLSIHSAVKEYLLIACEFLPWVAGLVIIYYCFLWWGIGSSFCAFLLMMGAHAVMRFMKARGAFQWPSYLPTRDDHQTAASDSDDDYDDDEDDTIETGFDPVPDLSAEKPPTYEAAVVKPPPYDLQYHLTPTHQPRGQVVSCKVASGQAEVVVRLLPPEMKLDNEDDVFLPSYHDAVALTDSGEAANA